MSNDFTEARFLSEGLLYTGSDGCNGYGVSFTSTILIMILWAREPSFVLDFELLLPSVLLVFGLNSAELRPVIDTGWMLAEPVIIPEGLGSSSVVHGLANVPIYF